MRHALLDSKVNDKYIYEVLRTSDLNNNNARKVPQEILFMDWQSKASLSYRIEEVKRESGEGV